MTRRLVVALLSLYVVWQGPGRASAATDTPPVEWHPAAASNGLTTLYAWTVAEGASRSIELQLFGTLSGTPIASKVQVPVADTASALCPEIQYVPERNAFAVVYSGYRALDAEDAQIDLEVVWISALTGNLLDQSTILQRVVRHVGEDFRPRENAFCPQLAYLRESHRLLVAWVASNIGATECGNTWVWDADTTTGADEFWGLQYDALDFFFTEPQVRLGPSRVFIRDPGTAINTLDISYAPPSATGFRVGNVLMAWAGFGPGLFQEQTNFVTFRANTLSAAPVDQSDWPDAVDAGFCAGASAGPGCLPSAIFAATVFQPRFLFDAPRFAIATADRLDVGGFANLYFVPASCDATSCTLTMAGDPDLSNVENAVALTGEDSIMLGISAAEGPCRVASALPWGTRGDRCVYVVFAFAPEPSAPTAWGLTGYGHRSFAVSTPGPEDWIPLGELPGLTRDTFGRPFTAVTGLTSSSLPFAPAVAVLYSVQRVDDGTPLDAFPRPYLIRLSTDGDLQSPPGEAGFID